MSPDSQEGALQIAAEHLASVSGFQALPGADRPSPFEVIIQQHNLPISAQQFAEDLARALQSVGRVVRRRKKDDVFEPVGTGFLVGRRLMLTNHHVLGDLEDLESSGGAYFFELDYRQEKSPRSQLPIRRILASSPPASSADELNAMRAPPAELDFALAELQEDVEEDRAFIDLLQRATTPRVGAPILVLQHPDGAPLRMGIDKVTAASRTRVRYSAPTRPGASGGPVFSMNFEIVALHHFGDPNAPPSFNQGIGAVQIRDAVRATITNAGSPSHERNGSDAGFNQKGSRTLVYWGLALLGGAVALAVIMLVWHPFGPKPSSVTSPILARPASWQVRANDDLNAEIDDQRFTITNMNGRFDLFFEGEVAICHAAIQPKMDCPKADKIVTGVAQFELHIQYRVPVHEGDGWTDAICRAKWPDASVVPGKHYAYVAPKLPCQLGEIAIKSGQELQVRVDMDESRCSFDNQASPCRARLNREDAVFRFRLQERP